MNGADPEEQSLIRRTEVTGRMFAYRSRTLRNATIGELYPATLVDGELGDKPLGGQARDVCSEITSLSQTRRNRSPPSVS